MSEETRQALSDAIQAHATDEWDNSLVVDWALTAATFTSDNEYAQGSVYSRSPAPAYVIRGLLTEALSHLDQEDDDD